MKSLKRIQRNLAEREMNYLGGVLRREDRAGTEVVVFYLRDRNGVETPDTTTSRTAFFCREHNWPLNWGALYSQPRR